MNIFNNYKLTQSQGMGRKKHLHIQDHSLIADNTRKAYVKGWQCFESYCHIKRLKSLPANTQTIRKFLIHKSADLSLGSLELYLSAINKTHVINSYPSFNSHLEVRNTMKGLARCNGRPVRRVKALLNTDLQTILDGLPQTLIGIRDAAILSVGFSAALRRSEICDLKFGDIEFIQSKVGMKMFLHIRRSKTDQTGLGYKIGVINGRCIKPVSRLKEWLRASKVEQGYLFRALKKGGAVKDTPLHHSDIPRLVKHYVNSINLNPKDYAGHSLRSGFITSAAIHKARLDKIMEISRHKSTDMVHELRTR